ncbi:MAG TPA: secretin N-terminal domain-containing protein, partial [bacterium]|nr:secretin N-terminal domain-containing protein [bacterium]
MILSHKTKTSTAFLFFVFLSLTLVLTFSALGEEGTYRVEFNNADITDAVRLLAKVGNKNIVVSDKVAGKVTASFDKITVGDALSAVLNSNGFGIVDRNHVLQVLGKEEMTAFGEDLTTSSYNLQYAKAEDILPHISSLVSERGSVIADKRTNTMHVRDTQASIQNISTLVFRLDRKGRQVLIEAKIIEATENFVRGLGIQWGVTRSGGNIQTAGLTTVGTD